MPKESTYYHIVDGMLVISNIADVNVNTRVIAKLKQSYLYTDTDRGKVGLITIDGVEYDYDISTDNAVTCVFQYPADFHAAKPTYDLHYRHNIDGLEVETNIEDRDSCRGVVTAMKRERIFISRIKLDKAAFPLAKAGSIRIGNEAYTFYIPNTGQVLFLHKVLSAPD